jgi:hypothetical protein
MPRMPRKTMGSKDFTKDSNDQLIVLAGALSEQLYDGLKERIILTYIPSHCGSVL